VERFAYRSSGGGRTHIPFEQNARIIGNATPRLAKLISSKYSHSNAGVVQEDLRETLHREVSRCFIRDLSALMAERIGEKPPRWGDGGDEPSPAQVATVGVGLDGTSQLFCDDGYRRPHRNLRRMGNWQSLPPDRRNQPNPLNQPVKHPS